MPFSIIVHFKVQTGPRLHAFRQRRSHMETRSSMSRPPLPECRSSLRASTSGVRHALERLGPSMAPISGVVSTESTIRTRGVLGQGS